MPEVKICDLLVKIMFVAMLKSTLYETTPSDQPASSGATLQLAPDPYSLVRVFPHMQVSVSMQSGRMIDDGS